MAEPATERVNIIDEDGGISNIEAADLDDALQGGYRLASEADLAADAEREQFQATGQQVRAGAEGAFRGITMGLGEGLLTGLDSPENVRKRKEYNPGIALGTEIAGGVAPLLLPGGGAGVLGRAAAATRTAGAAPRALAAVGGAVERKVASVAGEGLLAKGAALGAAGAVEGGVIGAGQAVSEAALEDEELTAERLIAGAKDGALLGGGLGGALGTGGGGLVKALNHGVEKAKPMLRQVFNSGRVDEFIAETAFSAAKGPGGGKKFVAEADKFHGGTAAVGKRLIDEGVVTKTSTIDDIAKAAKSKEVEYGNRISAGLKRMDDESAQWGRHADALLPTNQRMNERIEREVLGELEATGSPKLERLAGRVRKELTGQGLLTGGKKPRQFGFQELHKKRRTLDKAAFPDSKMRAPSELQEQLQAARKIVEEELESTSTAAARALGDDFADGYVQAKQGFRDMKLARKMSENASASVGANRNLSMSDMQVAQAAGAGEAIMGGGIDGGTMALAVASGYVHKVVRERGSAFLAGSLSEMRKSSQSAARVERTTESAVKKFLGKTKEKAKRAGSQVAGSRRERFDKSAKAVNSYAANPDSAIDKVADRMGRMGASERVATGYAAAVARGNEFLKSKLPAPLVRASDRQPDLNVTQRVSNADMAKFLRYSEAVTDPMSVIAALERGDMTRESAEALRTVYPKMYADLKERVTNHVVEARDRIPRSKLVQLSILFDEPYHFSMEPGFVATMQRVAGPAESPEARKQSFIAPSARQAPDSASQMQTNTQRLSQ